MKGIQNFSGKSIRFVLALLSLSVLVSEPGYSFQPGKRSDHRLWGNWVQQTQDEGYVIVGVKWSLGLGPGNAVLMRTNSEGTKKWLKVLGGPNMDQGNCVQQTADMGYIVAGTTWRRAHSRSDVFLTRTDSEGNVLWSSVFGGRERDHGSEVLQTTDGGYIVVGDTASYGAGSADVYLIKTDATGRNLWSKTFGGTRDDRGYSVQQAADGGYIVAGKTESFGEGEEEGFLVRTDSRGELLWKRTFGGKGRDGLRCVRQTPGGWILVGSTTSLGRGETDIYLIETDPEGNPNWIRTHGGRHGEFGHSVRPTKDGGYIAAGHIWPSGSLGNTDVYLLKTDRRGSKMWDQKFGGAGFDYAYCVQQTADGGYIVVGRSTSFGNQNDKVYLIKTDSDGNLMWHRIYG